VLMNNTLAFVTPIAPRAVPDTLEHLWSLPLVAQSLLSYAGSPLEAPHR
jgi:hypothetical protein